MIPLNVPSRAMLMLLCAASTLTAQEAKAPEKLPFYIYDDQRAHFHPAGLMGDAGDLYVMNASTQKPGKGSSCIKVCYSG